MTWFKFDDSAVDHPKIETLSDRSFRWWVRGLSYASRFLTDGLLPPIFWKKVPNQHRAELTGHRLWDWEDPNFLIHDYDKHQSSKEDVESDRDRGRANAKAYRDRRRAERRANIENVTDDGRKVVSDDGRKVVSDQGVINPEEESREQSKRTEKTPPASHGGGRLITTGSQWQRLMESHAFVGACLRVPKVLHSELMSKSGANADDELRKWYAQLDEQLEQSGKGTGDVFQWLRPRHQAFAISKGWIDAAPKAEAPKPKYRGVAEIMADAEAAKKAKAS